jgi:hypothetical protein
MREVMKRNLVHATFVAAFTAVACLGCNLLGAPSKIKAGERFETGEAKYDAYFKEVHDLQVAAASWSDDRKNACRDLFDDLKLTADVETISVVSATHDRVVAVSKDVGPTKLEITGDDVHLTAGNAGKVDESTRELFKAIEVCAHAEAQRAKALHVIPPKVEELTKTGHELEPHVREDFAKRGGHAGLDVQSELGISYGVLETIGRDAKNFARSSDDFVTNLQRAVGVDEGGPPAEVKEETKVASKGRGKGDKGDDAGAKSDKAEAKPDKPEKAEAPRPVARPARAPAPKAGKPAKKKAADEVFNP